MPTPSGRPTHTRPAPATAQTTVAVKTGPLRWHIAPGFHTRLFQQESPNWLDLDHDAHAQLIKANPRRRTYRVRFADFDLFAKTYRPADWRDWFKWPLRPAPSAAEFHLLRLARQRSVTAPTPIAYAQGPVNGKPFAMLLTESLCPARSLLDVLYDPQAPSETDLAAALEATAQLVAQLHCAGIAHRDLHPGNILLADQGPGQTQAYITDLQNVRTHQRSGHASADTLQPARLANLALLYSGLRLRLDENLLEHFLGVYRRSAQPQRRWTQAELDLFDQRLLRYADRQDRRIWRSRDRRALRNSPYSQRVKLATGWSARVFLQVKHPPDTSLAAQHCYTAQDWQKALAQPLTLLQTGEPPQNEGHTDVPSRQLTVGPVTLDVAVKQCRLRPGLKGLFDTLSRSWALRRYHQAHRLINRSLPTPWPLAALENRRPWLRQSILLTEHLPHACTLGDFVRQGSLPQGRQRSDLIDALADLLADLARKGLTCRNCSASSLLIQKTSNPHHPYQLFFGDLDALAPRRLPACLTPSFCQHLPAVQLASSLMGRHPNIHRTDYLRFLDHYAQRLNLPEAHDRPARKKLVRYLARLTRERQSSLLNS